MKTTNMVLAGAMALVLTGGAHAAGLSDGTFDEGAGAGSFATYGTGSNIGAWSVDSGSVDLIGSYWVGPPTGGYSVDLDGYFAAGTISQSFSLAAGTYNLSFWLAGNTDGGSTVKTVDVAVNGGAPAVFTFNTAGHDHNSMGWVQETVQFTTTGATTVSFASGDDAQSAWGAAVGGVTVSAVPEPATTTLLVGGLALIGMAARRRRQD